MLVVVYMGAVTHYVLRMVVVLELDLRIDRMREGFWNAPPHCCRRRRPGGAGNGGGPNGGFGTLDGGHAR